MPVAIEPARTTRLFSLEQRTQLRGTHRRRDAPVASMAYVAGVMVEEPDDWRGDAVTATIGEMDLGMPRPTLHLVHHLRLTGAPASVLLRQALARLTGHWQCRRIAVGVAEQKPFPSFPFPSPHDQTHTPHYSSLERFTLDRRTRALLGSTMLQAITAGRVKAYVQDLSDESREFCVQIVKARSRVGLDGALDLSVGSGGDAGYVISLALVVAAAQALLIPSQGHLTDLWCA